MAAIDDLILRVRTAIDDIAGDKTVFKEDLTRSLVGNQVGGGNTSFQVNNRRVVSGSFAVVSDGSVVSVSGSPDYKRGRFALAAAPATSLLVTYDYQFFDDTEITEFLNRAMDFVNGGTDPTLAPAGLKDTLIFKASSDACFALASRTGMLYDAQAGGKTAQKGDLAKKYKDIAKDLFDRAVAERDAFYGKRKGQSTSPSGGSFNTGQRPYTPPR